MFKIKKCILPATIFIALLVAPKQMFGMNEKDLSKAFLAAGGAAVSAVVVKKLSERSDLGESLSPGNAMFNVTLSLTSSAILAKGAPKVFEHCVSPRVVNNTGLTVVAGYAGYGSYCLYREGEVSKALFTGTVAASSLACLAMYNRDKGNKK